MAIVIISILYFEEFMAKLNEVDQRGPVLLEPVQYDMDREGVIVSVPDLGFITLKDSEAKTFFAWVDEYWLDEYESNLKAFSDDPEYGAQVTTTIPLVIFREVLCVRYVARQYPPTADLLKKLRDLTYQWRSRGVDTVMISAPRVKH